MTATPRPERDVRRTPCIFLPGQAVPYWCQAITPPEAVLRWTTITLVYQRQGHYVARKVIPANSIVYIRGKFDKVTITGQRPPGGYGDFEFNLRPIIPGWVIGMAAGIALMRWFA